MNKTQLVQRPTGVAQRIEPLIDEVAKVIVGKRDSLELVAMSFLTEGAHLLFEDLPGLGKSVMASAFSRASGSRFNRIQFTPDLLPSDITGTYVLDRRTSEFQFNEGPIFTNVLLADEINRASPKTQSALLEAMAEKQVSIEGKTHALPRPFLVLATQNPVEQEGTYPLPEAQLDRFMIKASVGHPSEDEEYEILKRRIERQRDEFVVESVTNAEQLVELQRSVESNITVHPDLVRYITRIIDATRNHPDVRAGASPRGSLALLKLGRARAALRGRQFVVPDDIQGLVHPVLGHRLIMHNEARMRGLTTNRVLTDILDKTPAPRP
ncbi:MAG: AAA family ATPase [Thermoplasmatota archaeon]